MRFPTFAPVLVLALGASAALAYDQPYKVIPGGDWDVDNGPIPYVLAPDGVDDISDGSDLDALRDAFRAWECIGGTKLRFEEQPGPGPAAQDDSDGKNTLFWDETGEYGLGPATLGVTIGDSTPGQKRKQADIIFNGFDSKWSTDGSAVDVGSIALHEIGHFAGLDHPCDGDAPNETNCNGADKSVMTPVWSGAVQRQPLPDDEEGMRFLYPADPDDTSTCQGPFRKGEKCSCDGDCVDGLVCAGVGDDQRVCAATCAADNIDCGDGFACALDKPEGDEKAPGVCVKAQSGHFPAGAICTTDHDCDSRKCSLIFSQARRVCAVKCDKDSDCKGAAGGEVCFENECVGAAAHDQCPDPNAAQGCACSSSSTSEASLALGALALALVGRARKRRTRGRG